MFNKKVSFIKFIFLVVLFDIALYHVPLFSFVVSNLDLSSVSGVLTVFSVVVSLFSVSAFILFLLASVLPVFMFKILVSVIFISNAIAVYFVNTYHVVLDKSMMGNVFNTRTVEAMSCYDSKIFIYIFVLGILPSVIFWKLKVIPSKRLKVLGVGIVSLVAGVFLMYLNSTTWLWFDKNARILGALAMPWSYSINAIRYKVKELKKSKVQVLLPDAKFVDDKKMVVVLVIGESARAKDFSLYGYDKKTNPLLEKEDVVVLKNSHSTATYTTASVHSILSYKGSSSDDFEPLPSYLHRAGAYVIWRSKNWGEPKLNIDKYQKAGELEKYCKTRGCKYDEVLDTNLTKEILDAPKKKVFIVLHTAGSHGPTYFKKYPKEFEKFKLVCKSVDLKTCSEEELINAYDNTIVYTDYFLDKTINFLKSLKGIPTVLLYLSDHGESLGEYGLYLHGTPYGIAPKFQKDIPFIVWESDAFLRSRGWNKPYVKKSNSYGQYNIFHTVLGAFGLKSSVYDKSLDLFSSD